MPTPANLGPSPLRAGRWQKTLVIGVLLAAAGCSGDADTGSTPRSTQPPAETGTGAAVPAFVREQFAAVIPLPGVTSMTTADRFLWVHADSTVVGIDPATNAAVGEPLPGQDRRQPAEPRRRGRVAVGRQP